MLLLLLALQDVDFGYDVRPILSDNCFTRHGSDEKRRGGDLRLDLKEGAFGEIEVTRREPDAEEAAAAEETSAQETNHDV